MYNIVTSNKAGYCLWLVAWKSCDSRVLILQQYIIYTEYDVWQHSFGFDTVALLPEEVSWFVARWSLVVAEGRRSSKLSFDIDSTDSGPDCLLCIPYLRESLFKVVLRDMPLISPGGLNASRWNFPLRGCISFFYTFKCFSSLYFIAF